MTIPALACPDVGVWRAWLDQEDHSPHLADHLAHCAGCQRVVADLRDDASAVNGLVDALAPAHLPSGAEVAVARERLAFKQRQGAAPSANPRPAREPIPMFLSRISTPWRIAASGVAAALVLSLVVAFSPEVQTAAAGFLAQFRSQQVTAIEITPQSQLEIQRTMNSLGNLGTIKFPMGPSRPEARGVGEYGTPAKQLSIADASQAVGFKLETPDPATLPAGVDKTPKVQVMPGTQIRFTFDKTKARTYFQSTGHPDVNLPDKFDGATLVVSIPTAALLQYADKSSREGLLIGQAGELVVDVEGKATLDEMREFLLSLPGMPSSVVSQLRNINKWNQTLPIPVPVDQVRWQSATIKGNQGLLLNDNSGIGSAAIWSEGGHMYGVAGSLKANELKRIADSLAAR